MKKIFIICSIIFISICISAQSQKATKTNFTDQLLELLNYSNDGFKTIKGEKIKTEKEDGPDYYMTNYSLEGAIENSIIEEYSSTDFNAVYGNDMKKTEGEDLYNKLITHLKKGFTNGYDLKENFEDLKYGNYLKALEIRRSDDKKHYIRLQLLFFAGGGNPLYEGATVKIIVGNL